MCDRTLQEVLMKEAQRFILNCKDHGMNVDSKIEIKNNVLRIKIDADNLPRC